MCLGLYLQHAIISVAVIAIAVVDSVIACSCVTWLLLVAWLYTYGYAIAILNYLLLSQMIPVLLLDTIMFVVVSQ